MRSLTVLTIKFWPYNRVAPAATISLTLAFTGIRLSAAKARISPASSWRMGAANRPY